MTTLQIIAAVLGLVGGVLWSTGRVVERWRPRPVYVTPDEARAEVMFAAAYGPDPDRIRGVKVLRERTGLGLKDAFDTVRRWLAEDGTPDSR